MDDSVREKLAAIRMVVFDVDGVLTDGRLLISDAGEESKSFSIRDGLGIVLAQRCGVGIALMSGRRSAAVAQRAKELGIPKERVVSGARDKADGLRRFMREHEFRNEELAFVGDDLNDLPAAEEVGLFVAVADAAEEVRERARLVLEANGGSGAAREIIETILKAQGRWEASIAAYLEFLKTPPETEIVSTQ